MFTLLQTFQAISLIFATSAVYTGLQAIFSPIAHAKLFGLPLLPSTNTERAQTYVSLMGARQLATGLILLTFAYQGKYNEMATMLTILGLMVAETDGIFLAKRDVKAGIFHALPGALIALLSFVVVYTDAGKRS